MSMISASHSENPRRRTAGKRLVIGVTGALVLSGVILAFVETGRNLFSQLRDKSEFNSLVAIRMALFEMNKDAQEPISLSSRCMNGRDLNWRVHLIPFLVDVLPGSEHSRRMLVSFHELCEQAGSTADESSVVMPFADGMPLRWTVCAITYDGVNFAPTGLTGYDRMRDNPIVAVAVIRPNSTWTTKFDILADKQTGRLTFTNAKEMEEDVDIRGCHAIRMNGTICRIPDMVAKDEIQMLLRTDRETNRVRKVSMD